VIKLCVNVEKMNGSMVIVY